MRPVEAGADVPLVIPCAQSELAVERTVGGASELGGAPQYERLAALVSAVHHAGSALRQREQVDLVDRRLASVPTSSLRLMCNFSTFHGLNQRIEPTYPAERSAKVLGPRSGGRAVIA